MNFFPKRNYFSTIEKISARGSGEINHKDKALHCTDSFLQLFLNPASLQDFYLNFYFGRNPIFFMPLNEKIEKFLHFTLCYLIFSN
jgi:hypothetical protein